MNWLSRIITRSQTGEVHWRLADFQPVITNSCRSGIGPIRIEVGNFGFRRLEYESEAFSRKDYEEM